ncbi:MAG TPA: hypothetical protein VG167_18985 [Verrucomicrobiae bacterium]|nr:hypothetical protein [Verrucomicrobiae bacterium]
MAGCAAALAQTTNAAVQWIWGDYTQTPETNRVIYITPLSAPWLPAGGQITSGDRLRYTNDSSGSLIVSNVITPGSYEVDFIGKYVTTIITNTFPLTNGFINGKWFISVPTNSPASGVAYSQAQSDARFVHLAGDTMFGALIDPLGFYGSSVTATQTLSIGTASFSMQPSNTTVDVTSGYDLSASRFIGDGNPGGDFVGSGAALSNVMAANIPAWTVNLPLVYAERSSGGGATGAAPVSGALITIVSNSHITLYNPVPWAMGWSKIVSRLTFESNVNNTFYLFVYAWSAGTSGSQQEGALSGQWVSVPANGIQSAWATNYFLNDNTPREVQIDVFGNNGYGNLTNYLWLDSWTVLGKD